MLKQVGQQIGGAGKTAVRQIVQEPLEILKTAGQQAGIEGGNTQPQQSPQTVPAQSVNVQPSVIEQNKDRILAAHRKELEDEITKRRKERVQEIEQRRLVEQRVEQKKKDEEEAKKESLFEKVKNMVTGRARKRVEARMPKAA